MEFYDPMERRCPWCSRPPIHRPQPRPPMRPNPGKRPPVPGPCPCNSLDPWNCPCRPEPPMHRPQPWPPMRPWGMSGQEAEFMDYDMGMSDETMTVNAMPIQAMPSQRRMPAEPMPDQMMPAEPMPGQMMPPEPPMPDQMMPPELPMPDQKMLQPRPPMTDFYEDEMENERELERLLNLYPEIARDLMPLVEAECDRLEYEGSMMFDEYPDRTMLGRVTARIYDQAKDRYNPPEGDDKDEALAMNVESRRRYPPRKNWLGDLIDVLFFDEMFRRRRRRRNYRRGY